jgi:hypothetical protein
LLGIAHDGTEREQTCHDGGADEGKSHAKHSLLFTGRPDLRRLTGDVGAPNAVIAGIHVFALMAKCLKSKGRILPPTGKCVKNWPVSIGNLCGPR